jgi:hypothetical protein
MACNGSFLLRLFGRHLSLYFRLSFGFVLISDLVDQIFNQFFFRISRSNLKISLTMALEGTFWDDRDRSKPPKPKGQWFRPSV